jgi:hypothetical protein
VQIGNPRWDLIRPVGHFHDSSKAAVRQNEGGIFLPSCTKSGKAD